MLVFHRPEDLAELDSAERRQVAVAIGNFDGCHLGHAALLRNMVRDAKREHLVPTVLTFFPHPVEVLNPGKKLLRLSTTSEKLALLEKLGVERVLVAPFTPDVSQLSPEQFFKRYLVETLNAGSVHVGFNFRFGKARAGDTHVLKELCEQKSITLHVEPAFFLNKEKVSSSFIRDQIQAGRVKEANVLLGHPYSIFGQVTFGDRRGSGLGFPTANLRCPIEKLLPQNGVYATRVVWQKQTFASVTNVGVRPTFHKDGESAPTVEVHLLNFHNKIYEEFLELKFVEKIRDEVRFTSKEALIDQIGKDVFSAKEILAKEL